ncbi:MAG: cupin domain-containing protein [Methanococcaceae archaeon]
MSKINLSEKFSLFSAYWDPKIIGELNGQYVKLAKLQGSFVWHKHDQEDELFFVIRGKLIIEFRDRTEELNEGEMIIVPRGFDHKPVAMEEVHVMLFEPVSTLNTGNMDNEMTKNELDKI